MPKGKGLQLGANKQPYRGVSDLAAELEREAAAGMGDAWGDERGEEDLMDVNADADDWSKFGSSSYLVGSDRNCLIMFATRSRL